MAIRETLFSQPIPIKVYPGRFAGDTVPRPLTVSVVQTMAAHSTLPEAVRVQVTDEADPTLLFSLECVIAARFVVAEGVRPLV